MRLGLSFTFNDQRDIYELSFISSIAILVWIITAKFPVFYLKTEIKSEISLPEFKSFWD